MDIAKLQQKLISAARSSPPADTVPFAFEARIMARVAGERPVDWISEWSLPLWRGAVACLGIAILLGAWAVLEPGPGAAAMDFSDQIENTVLAVADAEPTTTDPTW